jgi:hypothetical protein
MTAMPPATSDASDEALAERLRHDGVVVLPEPLPSDVVAELRGAFEPLLERYAGGTDPNRGPSRHQMYLPFEPPFSDPALWADPTVLRIVELVLGPDFECTYYGSDTPYPGSDHQPVHQDGGPLFPEWGTRPPLYCVAVNVPLVDVDADNGPLEWFPGTEQPEPDAEPERFTGPAGTMLLRDTRVWHRGSPNVGDGPRPMLALLYTRPWYRFPLDRPAMDRSLYEALPDPGRRLFRGADITPRQRAAGDRPRLGRDRT